MKSLSLLIPFLFAVAGGTFLVMSDGRSIGEVFVVKKMTKVFGLQHDRANVRSRLIRLDREKEYESYYLRQITIVSATGVATVVVGLGIFGSSFQVPLLSIGLACLSFIVIDRSLTRAVKNRKSAIENEFAPVIEMLTLSLSAGENPLGAMNRIAERSDGYLANEFRRVVDATRSGTSFHAALDSMGVRIDSVIIRRFVDSLITAMLRGAPLIEVLQRHALEARANQRNLLMDKAGKAEISMMIPVVFLILPISILFALWPSLTNLNLFAT